MARSANPADPVRRGAHPRILQVEFFSHGGLYHYGLQLALGLAAQGAEVLLLTGKNPELLPPAGARPDRLRLEPRLLTWNPCRGVKGWRRRPARGLHALQYLTAWEQVLARAQSWRPDWVLLGDLERRCDGWGVARLRQLGFPVADVWHNVQPISRIPGQPLTRFPAWRSRLAQVLDLLIVHGEKAGVQIRPYARRVLAIPHGDEGLLRAATGENPGLDQKYHLPSGLPLGLCFGSLTRYKGLEFLIESLAVLPADERPLLLIAGRPLADAEVGRWQARARELGLEPWLRWDLRYIPAEEVGWYFQRADFVCLPYQTITQSGVAHLGLTWGKPLMVTDVGELGSLVADRQDGWCVPPGDRAALARALREARLEPERLRCMKQAAHRRAQSHPSWDSIARQILQAMSAVRLDHAAASQPSPAEAGNQTSRNTGEAQVLNPKS